MSEAIFRRNLDNGFDISFE